MRPIPRWAVLSAALAPVFLIGGWTLAAARQPPGYRSTRDTVSALAGLGAADRWVMTFALAALGVCHIVTAAGLRPVARTGRVLLAIGGVAAILVAAFPLPRTGSSPVHGLVAGISLLALALWPAFARHIGWSIVLLGLLGWFAFQLYGQGPWIGLTERLVAGAEALVPLAVVARNRSTGSRRSSSAERILS